MSTRRPSAPPPNDAHAEERREMKERHRLVGRALFTRIVQRISGDATNGIPPLAVGTLDAEDIAKLTAAAVRLEQSGFAPEAVPQEAPETVAGMLDQLASGFGETAGTARAAATASAIWDRLVGVRKKHGKNGAAS